MLFPTNPPPSIVNGPKSWMIEAPPEEQGVSKMKTHHEQSNQQYEAHKQLASNKMIQESSVNLAQKRSAIKTRQE